MNRGAALLLGVLGACLPHYAVSRRDELPAWRYAVSGCVEARGPDLGPASWCVQAAVDHRWARDFRDGSMGWSARWTGGEALDGALFEVRTFDDGRMLTVDGVGARAGTAGHAELLDVLWPFFAPEVPNLPDGSAERVTSWRVEVPGAQGGRPRWSTRWELVDRDREGARLRATARLTGEGEGVRMDGALRASVRVDAEGRLVEATIEGERALVVQWPAGETRQDHAFTWELRREGEVAQPAVLLPYAPDAPWVDAEPLRLADGAAVGRDRIDARARLPWLLVDPALPEAEAQALRDHLFGAGRVGPAEP